MREQDEPSLQERLDFELPEFVRISWVSDIARDVWQPRLRRIMTVWDELELLTVAERVRPCCWTIVSSDDLISRSEQWLRMGLAALPFAKLHSEGTRPADGARVDSDTPVLYRVVVGRSADVLAFRDAYAAHDHTEMGRQLGYPPCCTGFFARHWGRAGRKDLTWLMTVHESVLHADTRIAVIEPLPSCNVLWRRLHIRAGPHLPCCFSCTPSQTLMDRIVDIGRASGHEDEMRWLVELLSWPAEWSALHGIAEVKTPILKLCTNTDATAFKYTLRLNGTHYPIEGARGAHFPYRPAD
jgi:hypothetical protein